MPEPRVYVVKGLGIGCHKEAAYAFERAGAKAELVHYRQLLSGGREFLFRSQILNLPGGFLHGDMGGAAMYAANELEHAGIHDLLVEYSQKGNVIYAQCNGFQLLVKTGLLPGINGDYSRQTVTLTNNDCGNYFVAPVMHRVETHHFAFEGLEEKLYMMCRHGEGKMQFYSRFGLISEADGEKNRIAVNEKHVLLRYIHPETGKSTQVFPYNPNGSIDAIAGLIDPTGNIIGHMGHTEVGILKSRNPRFFEWKDMLRRQGIKTEDLDDKMLEDICLQIFRNIVGHFK